jgi:exopolysaccharide production protein ExoZ
LRLSEGPDPKILSIQLLRGLAAGTVALAHLAYAYADHVGPGLGLPASDGQAAQAAVALFFLISGYIMVVSSAPLFGAAGAARRFWLRRAIRIAPPYWLATSRATTMAAAGGPLPLPQRLTGAVSTLGDASYAIYLLHVPVALAWPLIFPGRLYDLGPWFYLATLVVGTLVASLVFYAHVERPLTKALNRALGSAK